VTFLVMLIAGPWLSNILVQYTQGLISNIPYLIG
jgi:flagellar biosynthesis protein FliQ